MTFGAFFLDRHAFIIVMDKACVTGAAFAAEICPAVTAEQLGGQQIIVLGLVTGGSLFVLCQLCLHTFKQI